MNGVNDAMILRRFAQKLAGVNPAADNIVARDPANLADVQAGVPQRPGPSAPAAAAPASASADKNQSIMSAIHAALSKNHSLGGYNATGYDALTGLGGAAVGGMGAMGLARLFQSERDKERGRTPMLAGLAGAGAGVIGLPMLMKYLSSNSQNPSLAGSDMPIASPGADIPDLQSTRPMSAANIA